jgi:hypothetical protein
MGIFMKNYKHFTAPLTAFKLLALASALAIVSCAAVAPPTPFETTNVEVIVTGCEEAQKENPEFDC